MSSADDPAADQTPLGEGFAHLQAAAKEMVAAVRSFLDAVEDLVEDDDRFGQAVGQVSELVREASGSIARLGRVGGGPASPADAEPPRRRRIVVE